jgi:hypothetical protein
MIATRAPELPNSVGTIATQVSELSNRVGTFNTFVLASLEGLGMLCVPFLLSIIEKIPPDAVCI